MNSSQFTLTNHREFTVMYYSVNDLLANLISTKVHYFSMIGDHYLTASRGRLFSDSVSSSALVPLSLYPHHSALDGSHLISATACYEDNIK